MKLLISIFVAVLVVFGLAWFFTRDTDQPLVAVPETPIAEEPAQTTTTPQGLTFAIPSGFALATAGQPLLVQSYIPACSEGFGYCIYKNDNEFAGTNFESAGVAITNRTDIRAERLCLTTPPEGYTVEPSNTVSKDSYAASVFANIGDAAAGHSARDSVFRLFNRENSSCTEIVTRVAQSSYGNYPEGQIQEFTAQNKEKVQSELEAVLNTMTVAGQAITWPR